VRCDGARRIISNAKGAARSDIPDLREVIRVKPRYRPI
jgi:hypothetical protein